MPTKNVAGRKSRHGVHYFWSLKALSSCCASADDQGKLGGSRALVARRTSVCHGTCAGIPALSLESNYFERMRKILSQNGWPDVYEM